MIFEFFRTFKVPKKISAFGRKKNGDKQGGFLIKGGFLNINTPDGWLYCRQLGAKPSANECSVKLVASRDQTENQVCWRSAESRFAIIHEKPWVKGIRHLVGARLGYILDPGARGRGPRSAINGRQDSIHC